MAKRGDGGVASSVPMPVVVGLIVIVLGAVGFMGWKMFAPPPDPAAGMSAEQRRAEVQRRVKQTGQQLIMDRMMGNHSGIKGATK